MRSSTTLTSGGEAGSHLTFINFNCSTEYSTVFPVNRAPYAKLRALHTMSSDSKNSALDTSNGGAGGYVIAFGPRVIVAILLAIIASQQLWLWTVVRPDTASDVLVLYGSQP
jgi:hypothetical protein